MTEKAISQLKEVFSEYEELDTEITILENEHAGKLHKAKARLSIVHAKLAALISIISKNG